MKKLGWWEGGKRKLGDYYKPGQEVTPLRGGDNLKIAEVLICWQGLRYRMTDGSIQLEHKLRPAAAESKEQVSA